MKKYIISFICILLFITASCGASASSLQNTLERSGNIRIYTNNVKSFNNCSERIGKKDKEDAFLIYALNGARSVKVTVYSDALIEESRIAFYVSEDGEAYEPVKMYREFTENGNVGYSEYTLVAKGFPEDAQYFKIVMPATEKFSYLPQIGSVEFSDEDFEAKGLLFEDDFKNKNKMYDISSNFRFENGGSGYMGDNTTTLRMYDLDSAIKYNIKNPINLKLRYFIMDGKGEVEIYASSRDGDYTLVQSEKTLPFHSHNNWSGVDLTVQNFPEGTEYIMLKLPAHGHSPWPPVLTRLEVYY
ncbi:MAG: hypothetical protein J6C82_06955 [Clostridia bacterium]|nr:hypothetical protein [Clostridia bacterium]